MALSKYLHKKFYWIFEVMRGNQTRCQCNLKANQPHETSPKNHLFYLNSIRSLRLDEKKNKIIKFIVRHLLSLVCSFIRRSTFFFLSRHSFCVVSICVYDDRKRRYCFIIMSVWHSSSLKWLFKTMHLYARQFCSSICWVCVWSLSRLVSGMEFVLLELLWMERPRKRHTQREVKTARKGNLMSNIYSFHRVVYILNWNY